MGHDNWFTPTEIIEPIRKFYGGTIDLDPASCEKANETIRAKHYYRLSNDGGGLLRRWYGNVYCNPPYIGRSTVLDWMDKVADELTRHEHFNQVIMLLNRSDAKWYYDFLDNHRGGYYQFRTRIKFVNGESTGDKPSSPRYNNDLIYWGDNAKGFSDMCLTNFGKSTPQSFYCEN